MRDPNQDEVDLMYRAIGVALSNWSGVEDRLCTVFCRVTVASEQNYIPVRQAYWAVASFDAKLKMVDAAISAAFPDETAEAARAWTTVKNRLLKRNKTRNKIAHGTVVTFTVENKVRFCPFFWAQQTLNWHVPIPADAMKRDTVEAAGRAFISMLHSLRNLEGLIVSAMLASKSTV